MIEKEVPIKITFSEHVKRPRKHTQHIKRVRLYGPAEAFPEAIELEADEIASGGVLTIDDLTMDEDLEVVDRRDSDPIITVERPPAEKRARRDDWDD